MAPRYNKECCLAQALACKGLHMNSITADTSLQQSLSNLPGLTEVRDSQGTVLGYFSPVSYKTAEAYVQAAASFDPDEMRRRKSSNEPGRTTSEVLCRIENLEA
jgi:hypothetical protein